MSAEIQPIKVNFNATAIAKAQKTALADLKDLENASIDNDDDAREANDELRKQLAALDSVNALEQETTAPLAEGLKRVKALFKTAKDPINAVVSRLRALLEGYELEKRAAQRAAMAEAAHAAALPTPEKLTEALAKVEEAAPTTLEGTSFVRTWVVDRFALNCVLEELSGRKSRVAMTMIPDKFWIVDEKALAALGRAHKGDEPPIVPGVVWKEELSSRVRR